MLQFRFEAKVIHSRGPSPFFFVPISLQHSGEIRQLSKLVTYGWGMIPVEAAIAAVVFRTSLFPKDETYLFASQGRREAERQHNGRRFGLC